MHFGIKKIFLIIILVLLAFLVVPVPYYNKYDADCLPCPPIGACPPCPRKGWEFKKPILLQLIAISRPQQVSEVGETQLPQNGELVGGVGEKQPASRDKTDTPSVPEAPIMQLRYKGRVYSGLQGSGCWPYEEAGSVHHLCWDTELPNPSDTVPVSVGETLTVETRAHEKPSGLSATIFTSDGRQVVREVTLVRSLLTELEIDLPRGTYVVIIFGQWVEGDVSYGFKIEVI